MLKIQSISKSYLLNLIIIFGLFMSILAMLVVQFMVDDLQDRISSAKAEIVEYEDQMRLLEVQWVFLTRPERLRQLSETYLKDNGYVLVSQVVDNISTEGIVQDSSFVATKEEVNGSSKEELENREENFAAKKAEKTAINNGKLNSKKPAESKIINAAASKKIILRSSELHNLRSL